MKKKTLTQLINKNKEELLKDQQLLEKIEKRIDEKLSVVVNK